MLRIFAAPHLYVKPHNNQAHRMHVRPLTQFLAALMTAAQPLCALATESSVSTNSNLWPVYRDGELGYRISYPPDWQRAPTKGPNVRFSIVPPSPPGNCNLVVAQKPELAAMDQASLNTEVRSLGLDAQDWAGYVGAPRASIRLSQSRRTSVNGVAAIVGILETDIENLQGKFMRKQTVALMLHRGSIWTLNCGASDFNPVSVRARYDHLSPVLSKIIGSFGFLAATVSASPALAESLSPAQIQQIEQIAQSIAAQHNANAAAVLDDMTASSRATGVGRNVRFEYVLRVKKGLSPAKLKEFSDATKGEVIPKSCAANAKNPAFDRGLTYTFTYKNTYGEKLAEFTVDQLSCSSYR
jgi:hypothetical protein